MMDDFRLTEQHINNLIYHFPQEFPFFAISLTTVEYLVTQWKCKNEEARRKYENELIMENSLN